MMYKTLSLRNSLVLSLSLQFSFMSVGFAETKGICSSSAKPEASWNLSSKNLQKFANGIYRSENYLYYLVTTVLAKGNLFNDGPGGGGKTFATTLFFQAEINMLFTEAAKMPLAEQIKKAKEINTFLSELQSFVKEQRQNKTWDNPEYNQTIDQMARFFELQMHENMSEEPIFGTLNPFKLVSKDSEIHYDLSKALINAKNIFVILDEIDKASPAVQMVLLSILNEREALRGSDVIKLMVDTVVSTSNTSMAQLIAQAKPYEIGGRMALLDRFNTKFFTMNRGVDSKDITDYIDALDFADRELQNSVLNIRGIRPLLDKVRIPEEMIAPMTEIILQMDSLNTSKLNAAIERFNEGITNYTAFHPANTGSNRVNVNAWNYFRAAFISRQILSGISFDAIRFDMKPHDLVDLVPFLLHGSQAKIIEKINTSYKEVDVSIIDLIETKTVDHAFIEREQRRLTEKGEEFDPEAYQLGDLAIYKAYYNPMTNTLFFRSPVNENEIITFVYDRANKELFTGKDKALDFTIVNMRSKQEKLEIREIDESSVSDPFTKVKLENRNTVLSSLISFFTSLREEYSSNKELKGETEQDRKNREMFPKDIEEQIERIEADYKDEVFELEYTVEPYLKQMTDMLVQTPASEMQLKEISEAHERFIEKLNQSIKDLRGKTLNYEVKSPYLEKEEYFKEQAKQLSTELEEAYRSGSKEQKEAAAIRSVRAYFEEMSFKYIGADSNIESLMKGFLSGLNVLMYGPPGSAKTKMARTMIDSLLEVMNEEQMLDLVMELGELYHNLRKQGVDLAAFEKQFHPMSTEMDIFGISDIGALQRNEVKMIRDKSIVAKRFLFALLDEFEKAPVSLRTAMLSVLNERIAKDTGQPEKVNIYTIILITNSTPGEFIQAFDKSEFEKAYPVLSRIHQSTYVFNKLSNENTQELIRRMVYGFDMKIHNKLPLYQIKSLIEKYDYKELIGIEPVLVAVENSFMKEMFNGEGRFKAQLTDFLNGGRKSFYYPTAGYDLRRIASVFRKELVPAILMRRILRGESPESLADKELIEFHFEDLIAFMEIYTTSNPIFKFEAKYDNDGIIKYEVQDLTQAYGTSFMERLNSREAEALYNIKYEMDFMAKQMSNHVREYLKNKISLIHEYPDFFPDLFASLKDRIAFLKKFGLTMEQILDTYGTEGGDVYLELQKESEGN